MKAKKDGVYKVAKVLLAQNAADGIEDISKEKADGFNEDDGEDMIDEHIFRARSHGSKGSSSSSKKKW